MSTAISKPYKLTAGDVAESLWLTNAGNDDMTRRLKAMTGTPRDIAMLQYALDCERQGSFRASRMKPIESRLAALSKSVKPLDLHGESQPPDWSRARQILEGIRTCLRLSLAGQILLGQELLTIKMELNFLGRGGDRAKPHSEGLKSLNRTWEQWCKSELGISDQTADRKIEIYQAAKLRVKKLGGDKKLLGLLETHPAKIGEEDHKLLSGMVDKLVWGETQKSLLEELHLVKASKALEGGDTSGAKKKPEAQVIQQLAFAFFAPPFEKLADSVRKLGSLRIKQDYSAYLHQLEIASEDPKALTLTSLRDTLTAALTGDLKTTLAEVEAAIAAKSKPTLP
jgi:hypothetical protein